MTTSWSSDNTLWNNLTQIVHVIYQIKRRKNVDIFCWGAQGERPQWFIDDCFDAQREREPRPQVKLQMLTERQEETWFAAVQILTLRRNRFLARAEQGGKEKWIKNSVFFFFKSSHTAAAFMQWIDAASSSFIEMFELRAWSLDKQRTLSEY